MTDDPIRTAAEHLAGRIGTDAIGLIEAAFRQQRAEAEHRAKVDGWCDVCAGTGKVASADRCICDGTGLAAQAMVNLRVALLKAEQEVSRLRAALKAYGKHPATCPKGIGVGYYKPTANAVCECGIDAALQVGEAIPQERG